MTKNCDTFLVILILLLFGCSQNSNRQEKTDDLYNGFVNPPTEARPFVRWWWNGNNITSAEIKRELDILHAAGVGGVEINPIAMPPEAVDIGTKPVEWLSPEWNKLLVSAAQEAKNRGMITDIIVGSGWPFGGEFLKEEELIQRIITHKIQYSGGDRINEDRQSLVEKAVKAQNRQEGEAARSNDIFFLKLVPVKPSGMNGIIDLTDKLSEGNQLVFDVPPGNYELVYGIRQKGHREVMHGAPGAAGPVMDHYKKNVTLAYLNRLKKISDETGIPLKELIRALFCDSIELAGANWTDGFEETFYQTCKYRIEPYYPFIFYDSYIGYQDEEYSTGFMDEIKRVRYDYNSLLVRVFLENFTQPFQDFCTENGLKCRYQAYGTPFLMGMLEGNMIVDIPESNNWVYSVNMETEEWTWNQNHGYMLWNLYAASGGHLKDRKIISCESMTNTSGVFKLSLEEIKRHDDMNFITGINHTILHGFNYSPQEAGFPGWIRYGAYFNEQNTWWPYFSKWVNYNARLSYVFQNSNPVKNIAVLGPVGDIWSEYGLTRVPFHTKPWYCYRLWEALSQAGSSCDYISEKIIQEAGKSDGELKYGPMSYKAIILAGVRSIEPETANALEEFVKKGGKLLIVDSIPSRSLSLKGAAENDATVKKVISGIIGDYPEKVFHIAGPGSENELLPWAKDMLKQTDIRPDVGIEDPDKNIFQIHTKHGDKDIYFFTNSNRTKTVKLNAVFPTGRKTPWIWNPEDGSRKVFPYDKIRNELTIELQPLKSLILLFDQDMKGKPENDLHTLTGNVIMSLDGPWHVSFTNINGRSFDRTFEKLSDFGISDDSQLSSFAGTVFYTTTFSSDGDGNWLELGKVNKGITEVYLNGNMLGVNWYGRPLFPLDNHLLNGENLLEIKYTTVLSNYCRSLTDNPTAQRWTRGYENIPSGLEGEVHILQ
jgi:hypothetical protein